MELSQSLARADELKAQIDSLRPIKPEQEQRILQKFRLDWNYHSNAIEGNTLTLGETRAFLLEGLTAKGKPFKDHQDIKGHNQLIQFLEAFVRQKEVLGEAAIREMHKILLVEPYHVEARTPDGQTTRKLVKLGEYKTEPNFVQTATGEWIRYALPEDTAPKMAELVGWYRQQIETRSEHPLLVAALFHHRFTNIHPFDDGNGRMARALMNLILMREGFPPVIIKDKQRQEYVAALRKADAGDTAELVGFLCEELNWSLELFLRGAKGEDVQELNDLDKEIELFKRRLPDTEIPLEASVGTQDGVVVNSIVPLLNQLIPRMSRLDELFATSKREVEFRLQSEHSKYHTNPFKDATEVNLLAGQMIRTSLLRSMEVRFYWERFKRGGVNAHNLGSNFHVLFNDMSYRITTQPGFERTYIYQHRLSEDDIRTIVELMVRQNMKLIEDWVPQSSKKG